MRWLKAVLLAVAFVLLSGCGSSRDPVSTPPDPIQSSGAQIPHSQDFNRVFWGLWEVNISADRSTVDIIPDRTGVMHLNTVRLLEVEPCTNCISISNLLILPDNELQCEFRLRHPAPGLVEMTGFDVRGIFISGIDYTFPESGLGTSFTGNKPHLLFPDGYTQLFNPTMFPPTAPPALGYIEGRYANGGDLSATLNAFMGFENNTERRKFNPGVISTRTVKLKVPDGPLQFGYAVDACWQLMIEDPEPGEDPWPPDANCLEAYRIEAQIGRGLNPEDGGVADIIVEAWDHQGYEGISEVTLEAPDLFTGAITMTRSDPTSPESCLFTASITNDTGVTSGEYPVLITAVGADPDQNLGPIDAYNIVLANVGPPRGWVRTWGAEGWDESYSTAIDSDGNILVTGTFDGSVDFDPSDDVFIRITHGSYDVFLSKFNPAGEFLWVRTWGGYGSDTGFGVDTDEFNDIYVTGNFRRRCDFDPGDDVYYYESVDNTSDIFLSKITSDGEYCWARTWGSDEHDYGYELACDENGSVYATGCFRSTADFDPGPGVDERTAPGPLNGFDTYLCKYDLSGNLIWAHTWGDWWDDIGEGVAIAPNGDVYFGGVFKGTVDFDPGEDVDEHTSGETDAFLCKFTPDGDLIWARNWGGSLLEWVFDVSTDLYDGVYICGYFNSNVDFDPGPGECIRRTGSTENYDAYFSKFNSDGDFQWVQVWGGDPTSDTPMSSDSDEMGSVYVCGSYFYDVDFDTGDGIKTLSSNGERDCFLVKFSSAGSYMWAISWGGTIEDYAQSVAVADNHYVYVTGKFQQSLDFDPGMGEEWRTTNGWFDAYLVKFSPDGYW